MIFDHGGIKLGISRKKIEKPANVWKLSSASPNNRRSKDEIKGK